MSELVNFYTISPAELKPGKVMACVITCHISHIDPETDTVYIRLYRCGYPPQVSGEGIPQGSSPGNDIEIARTLFPVLNNFANIKIL